MEMAIKVITATMETKLPMESPKISSSLFSIPKLCVVLPVLDELEEDEPFELEDDEELLLELEEDELEEEATATGFVLAEPE